MLFWSSFNHLVAWFRTKSDSAPPVACKACKSVGFSPPAKLLFTPRNKHESQIRRMNLTYSYSQVLYYIIFSKYKISADPSRYRGERVRGPMPEDKWPGDVEQDCRKRCDRGPPAVDVRRRKRKCYKQSHLAGKSQQAGSELSFWLVLKAKLGTGKGGCGSRADSQGQGFSYGQRRRP